jgi:hypothetical protein
LNKRTRRNRRVLSPKALLAISSDSLVSTVF